jgi:hypothetical protein
MRFCQTIVLLLFASSALAQTSSRSEVAAAIDSWQSRASISAAILKISGDPGPALVAIANSKDESTIHRTHAISLLATIKSSGAEFGLEELANVGEPVFRCLGLQSLVELKSRDAIPTLINKLRDHDTCMKLNSSDPPREYDIYVSDEAVRLLELVTGQSFEPNFIYGHRKTEPWKKWWVKQKAVSSTPQPKDKDPNI